MTTRGAGAIACAGVAIVIVVANRALLFGGAHLVFDADALFGPYFLLVADHIRDGRLLQWDPWTLGGMPAGAQPEFGAMSPITLAFAWLSGGRIEGFYVYVIFVHALAGLGMYLLARSLEAPPWGAFATGLGFAFSGYALGHIQHTSWFFPFVFMPWVLWRLDVALRTGRLMAGAEAGAFWGVSLSGGYPSLVLTTGMIALLWTIGRGLTLPGDRSVGRRALLSLLIWAGVGGLILSPVCVTFLVEMRGYTDRSGVMTRDIAVNQNALHPLGLLTFASPHPSIWLLVARDWLPTDPSSLSIYVPVLVLWLAGLELVLGTDNRFRWWLLGIAILGIGLAVGGHLPFRGWFYDYFPPSRYFRHSSIFSTMTIFAVCVLAALGSRRLQNMFDSGRQGIGLVVIPLCLAGGAMVASQVLAASFHTDEPVPGQASGQVHFVFAWFGLMVVACIAWLVSLGRVGRDTAIRIALAFVIIDALWAHRLSQPLIHSDLAPLRSTWESLATYRKDGFDLTRTNAVDRSFFHDIGPFQTNKHLLLRAPMLWGYSPLTNVHFTKMTESPVLRDGALGKDRFWFAAEAVECPLSGESFEAFAARCGAVGGFVPVVHAPQAMRNASSRIEFEDMHQAEIARISKVERVFVEVEEYTPNTFRLRARVPRDGWLFVTDRWAPGWKAEVNGEATEVWGGLFVYRAVRVRGGINEVHFEYRPFGHPWLMMLSWTTLIACGVGALRSISTIRGR